MTKNYESSEEECHRKIRCKRGKRGFPGFQGPPGPTGSSGDVSYGEFISFQSQESQGGLTVVSFDTPTYTNGIELAPFSSGSVIIINNPGLYFLEYDLTFFNPNNEVDSPVIVGVATSFDLDYLELKVGTVPRTTFFFGILNLSSSRYLNVTEPSFIFLIWGSPLPGVQLFGDSEQVTSAQLSLTQISSSVPSPVRTRNLDLSAIDLDSVKEKFAQKIESLRSL